MASSTKDKDLGWRRLQRELRTLGGQPYVKAGILDSAGMHGDSGLHVAEVAAANEFGTDTIPERPFMRLSDKKIRADVDKMAPKLLGHIVSGRMNVSKMLDLIGLKAVARIKETIQGSVPPPNAPRTIARKGSSTTLVDTSQMYQSVNYEKVGA